MLFNNIPLKKVKIGLLIFIGVLVMAILPASVIGRSKYAPAAAPALGMICTTGDVGTPTFDLETQTGYFSSPDGNQVFMWGFAEAGGEFQMPGPILCVNQGDEVTVNLTNTALDEPVSIVFPGQIGVSATGGLPTAGLFTTEAAASSGVIPAEKTVSYSFTAGEPGTYLYESGTEQYKQVHMGLYGALIVRPSMGDNFAYNHASTEFAEEYLLLMHEIDPKLHLAVERNESYEVTGKHDRYWTLNGRSFPDVIAPNEAEWLPGQPYGGVVLVEANVGNPSFKPALIRYANAGWENHPFHPHGNSMTIIGRDGRKLDEAQVNFTTTVGSGQTYDLLFQWDEVVGENKNPPLTGYPVPDYLNRVYKDGVTWFSGAVNLGEPTEDTDFFPPDITNFNLCGEYYFPWHSHALHEIQNFDEGFGGMITVVGVLPAGGCAP